MIVYTATRRGFLDDARANRIHQRIAESFERRHGRKVPATEMSAWRNSMQFMATAVRDAHLPDDAGVSIEFGIPLSAKRIDFILSGRDDEGHGVAVIVELKQWSSVEVTDQDAIVRTVLGGKLVDTTHPSYQAWTYAALIEDYNETVQNEGIELVPCAYLHNLDTREAINDARYQEHTTRAPVFISEDVAKLSQFMARWVRKGDRDDLIYRIEHGRIRPSRRLSDAIVDMLEGQSRFTLIDDQKQVYERALVLAESTAGRKEHEVLIVSGGPGTGKSVVAINLLVEMTRRGLLAQYISRNAAPRAVYAAMLTGSVRKSRIDNLFRGSGSFVDSEPFTFDALIVDEAHRLTRKSGLYANLGENQVRELISASRTTVFFIDEDQRVTLDDIGTCEEIRAQAQVLGARVHELQLASQFRCSGSDGYLAFLDDTLQIRETANSTLSRSDYDLRVYDDPAVLHDEVRRLNGHGRTARMVAGYCWDWRSRKDPTATDIELPEHGYRAQWNLTKDGSTWLIAEGSVEQVGCIHTCQGLEVDYIGVIIGPDLIVRDGVVITDAARRSGMDRSVRGYKGALKRGADDAADARARADRIIRNTYRTLMTRGMKGCLLYCTDAETTTWFRNRIRDHVPMQEPPAPPATPDPLAGLTLPLAQPHGALAADERDDTQPRETLPVYDLRIAAGTFGHEQGPEAIAHVIAPAYIRPNAGMFVARVDGESMNRRIPNGAWCLFQRAPAGTLDGRILVIARHARAEVTGGSAYTVKRYRRTRSATSEEGAVAVSLVPESLDSSFEPIHLDPADAHELAVVAEFLLVLAQDEPQP